MMSITSYNKYVFILPHPDDELYCAALLRRLVTDQHPVTTIYLTSGDAGGVPAIREKELTCSLTAIGLVKPVLLRVKELELLKQLPEVIGQISTIVEQLTPDSVISPDYEGGHEGHDVANFVAAKIAEQSHAAHWVFPIYHAVRGQRKAALFQSGLESDQVLKLTKREQELKDKIITCHKSEHEHFEKLGRFDQTYYQRLKSSENYRRLISPINYLKPPAPEIGYESHRNGFKFADFKKAIGRVINET